MRFLWVIIFLICFSTFAQANPFCGPERIIQDAPLKMQIETAANALMNSDLKDVALAEKVQADQQTILKAHPLISREQAGIYYFQAACGAILKDSQSVTAENLQKLQIVTQALGDIPALSETIAKLAQSVQQPPQTTAYDSALQDNGVAGGLPQNNQENNEQKAKERSFEAQGNQTGQKAKSENCENLGEIGACSNIEDIVKNLKSANLKYNHPDTMYLGKRTEITLVVETTGEDQSKQLEDLSGDIKTGSTKISRIMEATLSGKEFKIEPSGPQRQTITTLAPVKWTWYVTPIEDGKLKRLNLELAAILRDGTRDLPPVSIKTFQTQIDVDVKWWDRVVFRLAQFDPVYQLMAAIGAFISLIVFLWRMGSWFRKSPGE